MIDLNFKKYGDHGPSFIILHGLFGMLDNWQSFAKKLVSKGFQVYAVDQRDHGKSPKTDSFSYDLIAADILRFCDQQNIDKAHFIGHSMGGKSTMRFTLLHPERVISQTIVDIAPRKYKAGHQLIFDALLSLNLSELKTRGEAEDALAKALKQKSTIQFLLKNLSRNKEGSFQWKMNLKLITDSYHENILPQVYTDNDLSYTPSLFVSGSESDYIQEQDLEIIENVFPNYTHEIVDEAGHWIHADQPDKLLELILDFID